MSVEITGEILPNNYKMKKMSVMLASRDAEIKALKSQLEDTKRRLEEKIDDLERSAAYWKKRYSAKVQPRIKPLLETKAEAQGICESMDESPVSPPISMEE
jgi:lipid A disaccharide synthetase